VAMWRVRAPRDAFRAFLKSVWEHDHLLLLRAARTRRRLVSIFRYAGFPVPHYFPNVVTLWRGTSNLSFAKARRGYSWTTDRDTACWFAMRHPMSGGSPLVLSVAVPKNDIALFHDERSEREVLLLKPPLTARIDGDAQDWARGYARWEFRKKADELKWLASRPGSP
jgi:hypothetical protein